MIKKIKISDFFVYLTLIVVFIIVVFPIVYTFLASFKTNQEILASGNTFFPEKISFDNYKLAWELGNFERYTYNSLYMTFFITLGVLSTSLVGGYVFARGDFIGRKFIFALFTSTMFISLGTLTIFPLLGIAKALNLHHSLWGVIIIRIFGLNITNIFLVRGFINAIPKEIDEAATIDGCGFFKIFYNIILPLLKPIIATVAIITFKNAWNDYLLPMVFTISNLDNAPLSVGLVALKSTGEAAGSWNLMLAGTVISMLPMLVVYLFFNRYFVSGMTTGAVKG